jgi:acetyl-CoA acetyltransferase
MRKVVVLGVGMTPFGRHPDLTIAELGRQAVVEAVADAGIDTNQIQAVYAGHARTGQLQQQENGVGQRICAEVGLPWVPVTGVGNYCASGSTAFREAYFSVASGFCEIALAVGVEKLSDRRGKGSPLVADGREQAEDGFTPVAYYAMIANRHRELFGTSSAELAAVAVKNRRFASTNPLAQYRVPISVDEVLAAPMIAAPLTLLSCCPTTDGASAAVLCSRVVARRYTTKPVSVSASSLTSGGYEMGGDITTAEIDVRAARAAYEAAGVGPMDIDVAEVHDAFTIAEVMHYEDLGFCPKGSGGKFVASGEAGPDGVVTVNPSGGLLSRGHPLGATGLAQVVEIARQLKGRAGDRQRDGARVGLTHCVGGFVKNDFAASSIHILQR